LVDLKPCAVPYLALLQQACVRNSRSTEAPVTCWRVRTSSRSCCRCSSGRLVAQAEGKRSTLQVGAAAGRGWWRVVLGIRRCWAKTPADLAAWCVPGWCSM